MFYGWAIPFTYKGKEYEWTSDNQLKWTDGSVNKNREISFDIGEENFIKELEEIMAHDY